MFHISCIFFKWFEFNLCCCCCKVRSRPLCLCSSSSMSRCCSSCWPTIFSVTKRSNSVSNVPCSCSSKCFILVKKIDAVVCLLLFNCSLNSLSRINYGQITTTQTLLLLVEKLKALCFERISALKVRSDVIFGFFLNVQVSVLLNGFIFWRTRWDSTWPAVSSSSSSSRRTRKCACSPTWPASTARRTRRNKTKSLYSISNRPRRLSNKINWVYITTTIWCVSIECQRITYFIINYI